jgi:predicted dehydrogenase
MTKSLSKVCWGIIGAGDVCEIKSGPSLQLADNSKLIAVMRRNADKAKDFAMRHGVKKWYNNADELIRDPEVNAIYIATPPSSHKFYTLKAAEAGKPVYVEKPMGLSYKECKEMVKVCKNLGVPLFVAYYRRALPNILKVKEIVESGIIGDIRFINIKMQKTIQPNILRTVKDPINWRLNPEVSGGGYFYDLASHQLDVMDFIFGPIIEAKGFSLNQAGQYPADDITMGIFKFENGILGQGVWTFNTNEISDIEQTVIEGSNGRVTFQFFGDNSVTVEVEGKAKEVFRFNISKHIQQALIQTIVDELINKGECDSTGTSAARTNWVMEEICGKYH